MHIKLHVIDQHCHYNLWCQITWAVKPMLVEQFGCNKIDAILPSYAHKNEFH